MTTATGEQNIVSEWREASLEYFLTEGFAFQNDSFVSPVPNSQCVVGSATETHKFIPRTRELNVGVHKFSAFSEYAVHLEARVLADIDVRRDSLLSDSKELPAVMDCNAANTISVIAIISLPFLGVQIVSLELVTSDVDDEVVV